MDPGAGHRVAQISRAMMSASEAGASTQVSALGGGGRDVWLLHCGAGGSTGTALPRMLLIYSRVNGAVGAVGHRGQRPDL